LSATSIGSPAFVRERRAFDEHDSTPVRERQLSVELSGDVAAPIVLDVTRRPIQTRATQPPRQAEELEMTEIARRDVLRAGAGGAAMLAVGVQRATAGVRRRSDPGAGTVIEWNRTLLGILRTPGAHPATVHPTRSFAILHAAVHDAVTAATGNHRPYQVDVRATRSASPVAAAAQAAHDTLTSDVLPGVTRVFHRFQEAAEEAGRSRIYAGVHTRIDHEAGQLLGRDVARVVAARAGSRLSRSVA
jgi:hypothetical protein